MPSGHNIDWKQYDEIIVLRLPTTTIKELATELGLHEKSLGRRARKLGTAHAKYKPSTDHKAKIGSSAERNWTDEEDKYLLDNADKLSINEMSKVIKIDNATIWRRLHKLGHVQSKEVIHAKISRRAKEKSASPEYRALLAKMPRGRKLSEEHKMKLAEARRKQSGRISKIQQALYDIAKSLNIVYYEEAHEKCRIGPWTFDGMVVSESGEETLIEVQGAWVHSQEKNIAKDVAKATYVANYFPHLRLEYILEAEFGSPNKVIDRLLKITNRLHVEDQSFSFRDVVVKIGDLKESREFITAHHYLGNLRGHLIVSGYIDNLLIVTAVLGVVTRKESASRLGLKTIECLELRRLVIRPGYNKKNFASWFLGKIKKFVSSNIKALITFADPTFGHSGTIYKAAGWEHDGHTESSYFYINSDGYVMHKKTLYERASSVHMKEAEYASSNGWSKVPTEPKERFIKWC